MHDIGATRLELGGPGGPGETELAQEGTPFGEMQELQLASELLEISRVRPSETAKSGFFKVSLQTGCSLLQPFIKVPHRLRIVKRRSRGQPDLTARGASCGAKGIRKQPEGWVKKHEGG